MFFLFLVPINNAVEWEAELIVPFLSFQTSNKESEYSKLGQEGKVVTQHASGLNRMLKCQKREAACVMY